MQLYLLAAFLCLVAGFGAGWRINDWRTSAEKNAEIKAAEAARVEAQARADEIATRFEERLNNIRIINRTINNEVRHETEKTVYTNCVVPDTGRSLLNRAIDTANNTSGKLDVSVSTVTKGTGEPASNDGGSAKPSDGNSSTVWGLRLPSWLSGGSNKKDATPGP